MTQAAPAGGGGSSSGSSSSGSTTYNIKPNPVSPAGEEQSMQYPQIMEILHGLQPGDMSDAADAFKNLATVLDSIASDLATTGNQLAPHWTGTAAQAAMNKFQSLHDQAAQLAADAHTTAGVASWLGSDVLPQFKNIPNPQVMSKSESDAAIGGAALGPEGAAGGYVLGAFGIGSDGTAKANSAARSYMSTLNQQLAKANEALPSTIAAPGSGPTNIGNTPWTTPTSGGSGSGGSGSGGGYGGGGYGGGSAMPTYPGSPMAPSSPMTAKMVPIPSSGSGSGAGSTPVGSLQGYQPPTTSPTTTSPYGGGSPVTTPSTYTGMPGGGSANPFSKIPAMPGGGTGSGSGAGAGEDEAMPGEGGLADGAAGEGLASGAAGDAAAGESAAAGEAAGGAEGAGGEGMGMPMGGAGSGQQNKERQRQAWMNEDDSIWGVPTNDVGPVIG